nr:MAG: hypothetical protein [Bacteriophage sp.]
MSSEDDVFGRLGNELLHHVLKELRKVRPAFHLILQRQHIHAFVHVHQIGQTVDNDGMDFWLSFSRCKRLRNLLDRIGDVVLFELSFKR